MKKRFLSLLCVLALCLGLLPATALAAGDDAPATLYVGETQITGSGYWTTDTNGKLSAGDASNYNVHYDGNGTLTLNNATIQGRGNVSEQDPQDYGIYASSTTGQSVSLTINLIGTNTVKGVGGIYFTSDGNSSLVIQSDSDASKGSLEVSGSGTTGIYIVVSRNSSGNPSLTINNASVEASTEKAGYYGVSIVSYTTSSPTLSLTVNGGSLTAQDGIRYVSVAGTNSSNSLTVSDSALIKAIPNISASGASKPTPQGNGIVFDGNSGTVYGDVTLDEPLNVGEVETLTIPEGSTLNTNGNLTNEGTINVESGGKLEGTTTGQGTLKIAPTITTQPQDVEVKENETAAFAVKVTGTEPLSYRWQQSTDSGRSWTDIGGATDATYITVATTTNMNGTQYRCVVSNSAGSVTSNVATLTVNKHVHTWGNPVWNWSEDGKTCTVTFTCQNDETHKETPTVTVTSAVKTPATCTETGVTTYTAIVELNGQTYTDTKEVADIPATGHRYENGKCTVCSAVDPAFKAMIIEGANGKWQKGSEDGLSFTSNAAFADFLKVQVDGKDVDASNYTVKEGSTLVTLNASYLETLSAGKHTLAIVSDTGTAETEFTVLAAEGEAADSKTANDSDKESLPETGDGSMLPIAALSILAMVSAAAGALSLRRIRL